MSPKITVLAEDSSPTLDDLLVMVNDPAGSPGTKKATINNLIKTMGWFDVRGYASLNVACASGDTLNKTIVIPNNQTLTANLTIENRTIVILPETGSITKASTYTLTFGTGSHFVNFDPLHHCFIGFNAGDITFGSGSILGPHPEWWSTNTTPGTTEMYTALQCALTATGGKFPLKLSNTYLSSTILAYDTTV